MPLPQRKKLPSPGRLRSLFSYDPSCGHLVRRIGVSRAAAGKIAGTTRGGYLICNVDGISYYVHRLVWMHYYGDQPPDLIDHIDNDGMNNRIENLRAATMAQNRRNSRGHRGSRAGMKGAHYYEHRFYSKIEVNGKVIRLGSFKTAEEAAAAYRQAATKYHGAFARTG